MPASAPDDARFSRRNGLLYGALGLPLAFVALPLYVLLPHHYATQHGLSLAALGAVLLGARLLDALIDPALGAWIDKLYARDTEAVRRFSAWACAVMALGFGSLFLVPKGVSGGALVVWLIAGLVLTYLCFSGVTVAHQAWAAKLGGSDVQRSRIVSWREGMSLLGVLMASALPSIIGMVSTVAVFAGMLAIGWGLWAVSAAPNRVPQVGRQTPSDLFAPLRLRAFRWVYGVFLLNGIASAIPATLLLFFVQDRLGAPASMQAPLLVTYFLGAALSLPVWARVVRRWGLELAWLLGMALAVVVFLWTVALGAGDVAPFLLICALSGLALGADLAVPSALLARVIAPRSDRARGVDEGLCFGWWNFAAKLNLALAGGLSLPALAWVGYEPGRASDGGLLALSLAYGLLPCGLKLLAGAALWWSWKKGFLK